MRGALAFSWRSLRRNWDAGELRVLIFGLLVAVASVTSVSFFTDRVEGAMEEQAGELLAADRVVESSRPLPAAWEAQARAYDLRTAQTLSFRSVVVVGEKLELAEVKAVGPGYPLRGKLRIASQPFGPEQVVPAGPAAGTAWAEPRLLQALGIRPGDKLMLGERELTLTAVLAYEPDRGAELFSIAPRLLISSDDVAATGLIQTGSLAHYDLLLAGDEENLERFARWVKPGMTAATRILGVRDARPEMTAALDHGRKYLSLASLVSVLLAGVAVAVAAGRYARRHLNEAAVMRCLGASQRFLALGFGLQLLWLALFAAVAGTFLGFVAHEVIVLIFGQLLTTHLPAPSPWPILYGAVTSLVTLAGFGLPPVLALRQVSPMRVLRRDLLPVPLAARIVYGSALAALTALMVWLSRDLRLAAVVLAGAVVTLVLLGGAAWALLSLLRPVRSAGRLGRAKLVWRFGMSALLRRPRSTTAQVLAFGLGIMVLLLLSVIRGDLMDQWRARLPADAPNEFLINVQPEQVDGIRDFLRARNLAVAPEFHPMVRGRLVAINDREVNAGEYADAHAQRLLRREFNLSWSRQVPPDNHVSAGRWWGKGGVSEWSVEEGLAKTLNLKLGDRLVFSVAGQRIAGQVTSLRRLDWDTFNVNFFVLAPPGVLESYPASDITSFHLAPEQKPLLADLVRAFPNLTVIDVDALMTRVRELMDRVALAVQFVFLFTLVAGLAVLYSAIQASHDERLHEAAVMRTLGARRRHILGALAVEFGLLGALAGLLAAASASLLAWALAKFVFEFAYTFNGWVWFAGVAGGVIGIGAAGLLGTRSVLEQPPLWTLRRF
jgi:putative ABC transport system permease protein